MRTKVSEIISTIDYYNRTGEFSDQDTLDMVVDFEVPDEMKMIVDMDDDENRVDMVKEMFEYMEKTHRKSTKHADYVMSFDEFLNESISPKTQSYMGKLEDCTHDDDFEEEE